MPICKQSESLPHSAEESRSGSRAQLVGCANAPFPPAVLELPLHCRLQAPLAAEAHREHRHVAAKPVYTAKPNCDARIQNPLAGIPRNALLRNVEKFATDKNLTDDLHLIQKGALVAQDPANYEDLTGEFALSEEETTALRSEVLHKWHQPRTLYLTIITCSIGAAVQGWDQTGSNGANLSMPKFFGIGSTSVHDTLLLGLVNSGPYIGSAFVGCWLSDPLNHYLGRRGAIFIAAIFCFLPVVGSAFTQKWYELFVCRLLLGFGMGAKGSTVPIFAAENSPAAIRGALVMSWQLWTAFGIFLGYCANLAMAHVGKNAWRLQLGSALIPAIPLILFIYLCPESPRWYMSMPPDRAI